MINSIALTFLTAETADTSAASSASSVSFIVSLVLMIAIFYFLIIRPQNKKDKEQKAMRNSLRIGDEVVTIGGIIGIIVHLNSETETILIETGSDRSRIRIKSWAISENLTKHDEQDEISKKKKSKKKDKIEEASDTSEK